MSTQLVIDKLREQQSRVSEHSAAWMVAEQLMEICRREPGSAELIAQDLDNPEMDIAHAEKQIKAYADANRNGAKCFCVSPVQAEEILRKFYGLHTSTGGEVFSAPIGLGLDLAAFLGG